MYGKVSIFVNLPPNFPTLPYSKHFKGRHFQKAKNKRKPFQKQHEENDDEDDLIYFMREIEHDEEEDRRDQMLLTIAEGKENMNELLNIKPLVKKVGEYVICTYEEDFFPELSVLMNMKLLSAQCKNREYEFTQGGHSIDEQCGMSLCNHLQVVLVSIIITKEVSELFFFLMWTLTTLRIR